MNNKLPWYFLGIYSFGAILCLILDFCFVGNGHTPTTNAFLPFIFLFGLFLSICETKNLTEIDAVHAMVFVLLFTALGPIYLFVRLVGFRAFDITNYVNKDK